MPHYILHSRLASPFGRKVLFSAAVLGLTDAVEFMKADDEDLLRTQNPLGKIPALILADGRALFDSPVILEFLDGETGGGKILPAAGEARFEALRQEAMADGILDAALLVLYERRYRPDEEPYEPWLDFQRGKIARALAAFAKSPPSLSPITVGGITLACALEYLDFRKGYDWRPEFPALVDWLGEVHAAYPAFADSTPTD
jgi:glutathione S-transferase